MGRALPVPLPQAPAVRPPLTARLIPTAASQTRDRALATFNHATSDRCAQLGRALSAAGLTWSDNGRQDAPQYLTYTVTDPHGRTWLVTPATNFQTSPSNPAQIWQASCGELTTTTPVLSARKVTEHIKDAP